MENTLHISPPKAPRPWQATIGAQVQLATVAPVAGLEFDGLDALDSFKVGFLWILYFYGFYEFFGC